MSFKIEARLPTRPAHDAETGTADMRVKAVHATVPSDLDSPIWHATVMPNTKPYTAGRRLDYGSDGSSHFTFMANKDVIDSIVLGEPHIGGVYLLRATGFRPSPYNELDVINEHDAEILDPNPVLVTYHDLSFDIRSVPPVRVTR